MRGADAWGRAVESERRELNERGEEQEREEEETRKRRDRETDRRREGRTLWPVTAES